MRRRNTAINLRALYNYWSNQMDKRIVFVISSYQIDFCLASLVLSITLAVTKKRNSIKPFNKKAGQTQVTKISGNCS